MVEQADAGEGHSDAVFIASGNDMVVAHAASGLCHILHAALVSTFDVVAEGEESIAAECHFRVLCNPGFLLLDGEGLGAFGEELLPCAIGQHVVIVFRDIDVDGVVAVGAADTRYEGEVHHFGVLTQPPDVSFVAGQACAVNAALLSGADADGLSVLGVANAVALCVFQGDEGNHQVAASGFAECFVRGRDIGKEFVAGEVYFVASLFESYAIHLFAFDGLGAIIGVHFQYVVSALALFAENFESFGGEVGSNHSVAHFTLDEQSGCLVASVREGDEVAVARHAVGTSGACVGCGDGAERLGDVVHEIDFAQGVAHGQSHGSTGRTDVLERGGGGQTCGGFQLAHQLPAVEGVKEVDVAGTAAEHFDGEFALFHVDA